MKKLALKQLEARKEEADQIARNARGKRTRADYAPQRAAFENLKKGVRKMPIPTRRELIERNRELEERVEDLQSGAWKRSARSRVPKRTTRRTKTTTNARTESRRHSSAADQITDRQSGTGLSIPSAARLDPPNVLYAVRLAFW